MFGEWMVMWHTIRTEWWVEKPGHKHTCFSHTTLCLTLGSDWSKALDKPRQWWTLTKESDTRNNWMVNVPDLLCLFSHFFFPLKALYTASLIHTLPDNTQSNLGLGVLLKDTLAWWFNQTPDLPVERRRPYCCITDAQINLWSRVQAHFTVTEVKLSAGEPWL